MIGKRKSFTMMILATQQLDINYGVVADLALRTFKSKISVLPDVQKRAVRYLYIGEGTA